ncbi:kinase-like domain-containing protein, partial [Amylostereum chailletii]
FVFLAELGHGGTGQVHLARHKCTMRVYALKSIDKGYIMHLERHHPGIKIDQAVDEMCLLRDASAGPFIMKLKAAFHDSAHFFFLNDYCPATLADVCGSGLHLSVVNFYTAEMASAITFIHRLGIVHRDIKPANILIDAQGHIQLADFGHAHRLEVNPSTRRARQQPPTTTGKFGTPGFIAWEVVRGYPYSYSVDFFSLGVVLHIM